MSLGGKLCTWGRISFFRVPTTIIRLPCFYFIDKGRVRLTYTNAAGEDHVVMFFGKGCIFNETSVITGDEATMACFRVLERTEAYRFPSSLIHDAEFARQYPHLILNMLRGTATKFSNLFSVSFLIKHGTRWPVTTFCASSPQP
ncbi:MAG: Crp/Fnr family transcriptional regulator [Bilophila wadsworthia]